MFHQQCAQSNVASCRLAKFALLIAEAAIVAAVLSLFTTNSVHAEGVPLLSIPAASPQQALKEPSLLAKPPLNKVGNPADDARQACYSDEQADCVFRLSNTEKVRRFDGMTNSLEILRPQRIHSFSKFACLTALSNAL